MKILVTLNTGEIAYNDITYNRLYLKLILFINKIKYVL